MINFKQEELIEQLVNHIQQKYPEVQLIEVTESPEDSDSLWLIVTAPEDEDRESELITYSADKSMDILLDYGYHMLVMPTHETGLEAA
ncbi:Uncharacterized protein dnl_55060 [Desulfonema limicola]|uniref:Uncharacterized protein n=1 Tax=Desulfonema limicola TaxID=45656 RepID=A0A975GJ07_9BACT|nr:hypothetical protein [Desulfonema limicola]QTA83112.1 Uncharacterized protein dnl_55060 [Desulfonema limicola]